MDEMVRAINGLKDGKPPGGDGIPAEVWKYGGDNLSQQTAPMDYQNMGGWSSTISMERCQPSTEKETEHNILITEVYLFFLQPARSLLGSY